MLDGVTVFLTLITYYLLQELVEAPVRKGPPLRKYKVFILLSIQGFSFAINLIDRHAQKNVNLWEFMKHSFVLTTFPFPLRPFLLSVPVVAVKHWALYVAR